MNIISLGLQASIICYVFPLFPLSSLNASSDSLNASYRSFNFFLPVLEGTLWLQILVKKREKARVASDVKVLTLPRENVLLMKI